MDFNDYPALYKSADSGSRAAQRRFLWNVGGEYFLLALLAVSTNLSATVSFADQLSLFLATVLTGLLIYRLYSKDEVQWYKCRALAESIKTSAWRFACRAHPYEDVPDRSVAVRNFINDLVRIQSDNEFIGEALDEKHADADQISNTMFEIRLKTLEERLQYYLDNRVREQRTWYAKKAGFNRRRRRTWFAFGLLSYAVVFASIVFREHNAITLSATTGLFLVLITSSIGWMQLRRHGELAASYLLTAHEIGNLLQAAGDVRTEEGLSEYVNASEFAFSREHTQWVARASAV